MMRDAAPIVANIPASLLNAGKRFVVWRYEERAGGRTKVPYCPHALQRRASVSNPRTWGTFLEARAPVLDGHADGVGIVLDKSLGVVFLDIDQCVGPNGVIDPGARKLIGQVDSYTEYSPNNGVHIFARASMAGGDHV